jgi:hypothetical protein
MGNRRAATNWRRGALIVPVFNTALNLSRPAFSSQRLGLLATNCVPFGVRICAHASVANSTSLYACAASLVAAKGRKKLPPFAGSGNGATSAQWPTAGSRCAAGFAPAPKFDPFHPATTGAGGRQTAKASAAGSRGFRNSQAAGAVTLAAAHCWPRVSCRPPTSSVAGRPRLVPLAVATHFGD